MVDRYLLTCPDCGERTLVDGDVRDLLLSEGCAVCGSAVSPSAFRSADE